MAYWRGREAWTHTASAMALLANCHAPQGRRFYVRDFHPYELLSSSKGRRRVSPEAWDKIMDRTEVRLLGKGKKAPSKRLTAEERAALRRDGELTRAALRD